jgi:DNA-binding response OmpR family regulator
MGDSILALLVEDDVRLARFTADYLSERDVIVTHVTDGEAALAAASTRRFDVVALDVLLPRRDGLSVCRSIRETSDVPIVMVTACVEEADRVIGLETGADDYVIKPFSPRELLARMRAVVRRDRGKLTPGARILEMGPLVIQTANRTVRVGGQPVPLTSGEFDLLVALAAHPGRIFSRDQLLRLARGSDDSAFDRAIDVQISRLRQKLAVHAGGASLIRTIRGVGYMMADGDGT